MSYHSILNDAIGLVMRGPSSSHCASALRIGLLCRDLIRGCIKTVQIEFDPNGSLVTTHASQGSDMGLFGGLLLTGLLGGISESEVRVNDTNIIRFKSC